MYWEIACLAKILRYISPLGGRSEGQEPYEDELLAGLRYTIRDERIWLKRTKDG